MLLKLLLLIFLFPSLCYGTTLWEADWSNGTGTGQTAIRDGEEFSGEGKSGDQSHYWFEVFPTDGTVPGRRNYLRVYRVHDGSSILYGKYGGPMGCPQTLYFRIWFRYHTENTGILHLIRIMETYGAGNYDNSRDWVAFDIRGGYVGFIIRSLGNFPWVVKSNVRDNRWHLYELKVENAGTSFGRFSMRIDGVDRTSSVVDINTDRPLSQVNGSLTIGCPYYQNWEAYDAAAAEYACVDVAAAKFTDGPDWIGDDSGGVPQGDSNTSQSDNSGGGGCFIATAAFGTPTNSHVAILREFRDRILLRFSIGESLVSLYYKVSPPIADFISKHDLLKSLVRILLIPLVGFCWVTLHIKSLFAVGIVLILLIVPTIYFFLQIFRVSSRKDRI